MANRAANQRVHQVRCDLCEHGAKGQKTGMPIKRPAKLLTTRRDFQQLRRACGRSSVYPDWFCRSVVRLVEQIMRWQCRRRAREPEPMGDGEDFAETHDVKADEIVDGRIGVGAVISTKKAAACYKQAELTLLWRLRIIHLMEIWVAAAEGLVCGVCRSQHRPGAKGSARLQFVRDFGDDVRFACFELKYVEGKSYWYCSIGDSAATIHVAMLIASRASQELASAFERTMVDSSITGQDEMRSLGIVVSGAKNSFRRRACFGPAQWVLGRDLRMPADLVGDAADCSARGLAASDENICGRCALRAAALESFKRMENDDQFRWGLLSRARTVATPVSVGEMRYVLRQIKMKEQREQRNRNDKKCICRAMLVAPEHIEALAPEDVWFPNGRGEIGLAVAELNRARNSLELEEALVEDVRRQPGWSEIRPDEMEADWRGFIEKPEDDDVRVETGVDEEPGAVVEALELTPGTDIIMHQSPPCPLGPAEFRRRRATFDGGDSSDFGLKRLQMSRHQPGASVEPARAASREPKVAADGEAVAEPPAGGVRDRSRSAPRQALQTSIVAERVKRKQADKDIRWKDIKGTDREAVGRTVKPGMILISRFVYWLSSLDPKQLIRILKGVFGLSTAPKVVGDSLRKGRKTELTAEATPAEFSDKRSALGALGWLSSQIRPDLVAGVAMGQHAQDKPTVQDLLESDRLSKQARKRAGAGLELPELHCPLCLVPYRDASRANADEEPPGPFFSPLNEFTSAEENHFHIRSQAGRVACLAEAGIPRGGRRLPSSVVAVTESIPETASACWEIRGFSLMDRRPDRFIESPPLVEVAGKHFKLRSGVPWRVPEGKRLWRVLDLL
ncbi:unnamed protein product [Prorocentrum cordatum]|uniref:Uncharacterized protein n=1 Tax=Prorocentrum cordatum TaxID=2364126 RepID=A0ABN9VZI5_9DINO|nr:unnamed protein product [Polarella glacialis]